MTNSLRRSFFLSSTQRAIHSNSPAHRTGLDAKSELFRPEGPTIRLRIRILNAKRTVGRSGLTLILSFDPARWAGLFEQMAPLAVELVLSFVSRTKFYKRRYSSTHTLLDSSHSYPFGEISIYVIRSDTNARHLFAHMVFCRVARRNWTCKGEKP